MISDDEVSSEIAVEFLGDEIGRIRLGLDTVKDEVKIILVGLDLGLIARLAAVFDRQIMKLEDIQQNRFRELDLVIRLGVEISPNKNVFVVEQFREIFGGKSIFNGFGTVAINDYFEHCLWPAFAGVVTKFEPAGFPLRKKQ